MIGVNVVIGVVCVAMVLVIAAFIWKYNQDKSKNVAEVFHELIDDVEETVEEVAEDIKEELEEAVEDVKEEAVEVFDNFQDLIADKAVLILIESLSRIKTKTRAWFMENGKTKVEADEIMADISKPFDAKGMDLESAPFKFTTK